MIGVSRCVMNVRITSATVVFFFFFQAEDGIRDYKVTGVQTCALPISMDWRRVLMRAAAVECQVAGEEEQTQAAQSASTWASMYSSMIARPRWMAIRSEEGRVGEEGRSRWAPDH